MYSQSMTSETQIMDYLVILRVDDGLIEPLSAGHDDVLTCHAAVGSFDETY